MRCPRRRNSGQDRVSHRYSPTASIGIKKPMGALGQRRQGHADVEEPHSVTFAPSPCTPSQNPYRDRVVKKISTLSVRRHATQPDNLQVQ